jgi:hypothetical protein
MSDEGFLSTDSEEQAAEDNAEGDKIVDTQVVEDTAEAPESGVIRPVSDIESVVEVYEEFDEIKDRLLDKNDIQKISGSPHVTKSGWRKIATAFNVSVEVTEEEKVVEDGVIKYKVTAEATAPNGKTMTGGGMCSSNESNFTEKMTGGSVDEYRDRDDVFKIDGSWRRVKPPKAVNEHNVRAIAETRAKNRAISDLVGGGEVSAEEMSAEDVL